MKNKQEPNKSISPRRDLNKELSEGFTALKQEREGKRTLRSHPVKFLAPPEIMPEELIRLRQELNLSRAVFAAYLRTRALWKAGSRAVLVPMPRPPC